MSLDLAAALGLFLGAGIIVVFAAINLATAGEVIAARTGWGRMWVGSLLLAGATSLPELITNVSAVRIQAPALAAGDILGANMMNMATLAVLASSLGGAGLFQRLLPQQGLLLAMAVGLTGLATVLAALQPDIRWGVLSLASLVILTSYLAASRALARFSTGAPGPEVELLPTRSLRWGWTTFTMAATAIVVAAPFLAISADRIAELTSLGESFVGVIAVALVTTLPEAATTGAALRIGAPDLAFSGMYGTNSLNVVILGIADFFSPGDSLFSQLDRSHVLAGLFAMLLMALSGARLLVRGAKNQAALTYLWAAGIVGIYAAGLVLVYRAS